MVESLILFDRYDARAEILIDRPDETVRQLFFYDKNEYVTIDS